MVSSLTATWLLSTLTQALDVDTVKKQWTIAAEKGYQPAIIAMAGDASCWPLCSVLALCLTRPGADLHSGDRFPNELSELTSRSWVRRANTKKLKALAEAGDLDAMCWLAECYFRVRVS